MGLNLTVALNIINCTKNIKKGKVLCLGAQTLKFSIKELINSKDLFDGTVNLKSFEDLNVKLVPTQEVFFKTLGFSQVDTLDVDNYEGASILFDLNKEFTPEDLIGNYDFIYDGGTLEHVFNTGNALKHLTRMVKKDGLIFHSNPCNGYVDHGFFQISPTFYFDYYLSNDLEIIYSGIIEQSFGQKIYAVRQDLYRTLDNNFGPKKTPKGLLNFCAKKTYEIDKIITPQQGFYSSLWKDNMQKTYEVKEHLPFTKYLLLQKIFHIYNNVPYFLIHIMRILKSTIK
jgi:2-polyprenyl-3-methyl-5-hydroxy-6-metoxy-1,4-benzoquinol methylase